MSSAITQHFYKFSSKMNQNSSSLGSSYGSSPPLYLTSEGSHRGSSTNYSFIDKGRSPSDKNLEELSQGFGAHEMFLDESSQNSLPGDPLPGDPPKKALLSKITHSVGNEPDPFVKFFVVKLRGNSLYHQTAQCITCDHLIATLRGNPKSVTFNSSGLMIVQAKDKDQSEVLSQTTVMGGIAVTVSPHSQLNNVSGVIESDRLWKEGSNKNVVTQLAHEGVVSATINEPASRQDGSLSLLVDVTFKNRSKLPISVKTRKGYEVEVRSRIPSPRQCLKCFRFGHEMFQCYETCRICENCSGDLGYHFQQPCENKTRCVNCGSSLHGALSRHCSALHKAWRINIVAVSTDVDFMAAKRLVDAEIDDCESRGMTYEEEYPLSTRYFASTSRNSLTSTSPNSNIPKSHWSPNIGKIGYFHNKPPSTNPRFPIYKNFDFPARSSNSWRHSFGYEPNYFTYGGDYYENFEDPYGDGFESPEQLISNSDDTLSCSPNITCSISDSSPMVKSRRRTGISENSSSWREDLHSSFPCDWHNVLDSIYADCVAELVDPMTILISVNNRYSNMVLLTEKVVSEDDGTACGFQYFLLSNIFSSKFCWKPVTEESIESFCNITESGCNDPAVESSNEFTKFTTRKDPTVGSPNESTESTTRNDLAVGSPSGYSECTKSNDLVEEVDTPRNQGVNSTGSLEDCSDTYAAFRCKRILRGLDCDWSCRKSHRLPKDDGVRCILERFGHCHQGQNCNFLHGVSQHEGGLSSSSADTDSDSKSDSEENSVMITVSPTDNLLGKMNSK